MCIIAIKPKNAVISVNRLKNCWENNSDGAGFMYAEDGQLIIEKGLMTLDNLIEAYDKIKPEEKDVVLHFRFGTHGKVCKSLTHPFSVNPKLDLVHNGIFSIDSEDESDIPRVGKDIGKYIAKKQKEEEERLKNVLDSRFGKKGKFHTSRFISGYNTNYEKYTHYITDLRKEENEDTSDTLEFCKILMKFPKDFLSKKEVFFFLNNYVASENSVVVFMDNLGTIDIVGINNNNIDNGVWYSNNDYMNKPLRYFKKKSKSSPLTLADVSRANNIPEKLGAEELDLSDFDRDITPNNNTKMKGQYHGELWRDYED